MSRRAASVSPGSPASPGRPDWLSFCAQLSSDRTEALRLRGLLTAYRVVIPDVIDPSLVEGLQHMSPEYLKGIRRILTVSADTALVSAPAMAQEYRNVAYDDSMERVIITAPRPPQDRSAIGAPIVDVAISREIRIDDLDLRTGYGVRMLERRVSDTAHDLCRRLDLRYPITASDSPPCYEAAFEDAMEQADAAIARARGED